MSAPTLSAIGLKPATLRAARRRVRDQGKSVIEYLRELVERDVRAGGSFDEVLRPFREGFRRSGVTEDELDDLVAAARHAHHRRASRKPRK